MAMTLETKRKIIAWLIAANAVMALILLLK